MPINSIKLTDDFHQDEPLGYLVKCYDATMHEYKLFENLSEAERFAVRQESEAADAGEPEDWLIYPLYAANPIED